VLTLYHWEPVASCALPLIALAEKHLSYESRYVDVLRLEQLEPGFLALNPQGQVPVLVHEERVITESTLMLEYLEAVFPQPSLAPASAHDAYRMQVWLKFVDEYFAPALALLGWQRFGAGARASLDGARARSAITRLPLERQAVWKAALDGHADEQLAAARRGLELRVPRVEEALSATQWLAGPDFSLADIAVFAMLKPLPHLLPELVNRSAMPAVIAWLEAVAHRPAVAAVLGKARVAVPDEIFAPGPESGRWG
jgi:GSH-dependent disulfide-bond oxidoreductase